MKLDEYVVRGSLILLDDVWYVMIKRSDYYNTGKMEYWCIPRGDLEKGRMRGYLRIAPDVGVTAFFPGNVHPLPNYIK